MILLRLLAAVLFLGGLLAAQGWGFAQSDVHALAFDSAGLLAWVVSTFPVPVAPPPR